MVVIIIIFVVAALSYLVYRGYTESYTPEQQIMLQQHCSSCAGY